MLSLKWATKLSVCRTESEASTAASTSLLDDSGADEDGNSITSTSSLRTLLTFLSDDLWEQVLCFMVANLASCKNVSAVSRRLLTISHSPVSWMGANIQLPGAAMMNEHHVKQVLKLAASWRLAKSLSLTAHPRRQSLTTELQNICPELEISVAAPGPYLMFVMPCYCDIGEEMGLHFFEPRYRWMCRRIFEAQRPHVFAFVTHGGPSPGSTGVLCEVSRFRGNPNGTFDVNFVARSSFSVLEVWPEEVPDEPRAPALAVGLLDINEPIEKSADTPSVLMVQNRHMSAGRTSQMLQARLAAILRCFAASLLCCPRRR